MEKPKHPLHLKYPDLHLSDEVENAAERTEDRTGKKVLNNPDAHIQNYLDRLEHLALDPEKKQKRKMFGDEPRPRALSLLREMVMNTYVRPHKEKMAEGAARVQERAAREMGIVAHYGEDELEQRREIVVEDLEKSLDNWIAYLSDANEPYPAWFRYYAFRNVIDLGDYDKDKGEFTRRSRGSAHLFPDVDRGSLAYVEQMIEAANDPTVLERLQKAQRAAALENIPKDQLITKEKAVQFAKLSFAKQYAEGIRQAGEITPEMREEMRGKWITYQKDTDPTALWSSLQNKGTAWCTKGFATAETQLKGGDFHVYYTLDKHGRPAIPRIAIRMQGDQIGEVRGVADNQQNLEGTMAAIAEEKMKELPGAERYKKASADMKALTIIEKKTDRGEKLTKEDLVLLYEINGTIEGFGYQKDPRIAELRKDRNADEDMLTIFECTKAEIAHVPSEITENIKAYVGQLEPGIFQKMPEHLEHVYTSFPESKIRFDSVEIGGKTKGELAKELERQGIQVSKNADFMLKSEEFTTLKRVERAGLVRLSVASLGFPLGATTREIYDRAEELGLELCPAEVGPHYRLAYVDQPLGEWLAIGMKQIRGSVGLSSVFTLERRGGGLWLDDGWWKPDYRWDPGYSFVFRLRRASSKLEK